jgi:folate-binding Fe-S cluster repair protein YgfZ
MEGEYNQLMLERQKQLEEALDKAESGEASPEDWAIIRYECGIPQRKRSEA